MQIVTCVFPVPLSTMLYWAAMWLDSCSLEALNTSCLILAIRSVTYTLPRPSAWSFSFQVLKNCLKMGVSPPSGRTWICVQGRKDLGDPKNTIHFPCLKKVQKLYILGIQHLGAIIYPWCTLKVLLWTFQSCFFFWQFWYIQLWLVCSLIQVNVNNAAKHIHISNVSEPGCWQDIPSA